MTQDMTKDMILHTMTKKLVRNWRTRVLSAAHSSSLTGALTQGRHLCADEITARPSRDYGSSVTRLRLVVTMLLLLTLGSGSVWGQTTPETESGLNGDGYYYITSNGDNSYYLCPAGALYVTYDVGQPYLTTNTTGQVNGSLWIIQFIGTESSYQIKHYGDNKYLTHNTSKSDNSSRLRVHLQPEDGGDNSLFTIPENGTQIYNIVPKTETDGLNPANGNRAGDVGVNSSTVKINGTTYNVGGMIGLYSKSDNNSKWKLTFVKKCVTPEITVDGSGNVTITSVTSGATICYTNDGSDPAISDTKRTYSASFSLGTAIKIRAIAIKDGFTNSDEATYSAVQCKTPTILLNKETGLTTITPHADNPGAAIYYTTDGSAPTISSTRYTEPFTLSLEASGIMAIASESADGSDASEVVEYVLTKLALPTFSKNGATVTINKPTKDTNGTNLEGAADVEIHYNQNNTDPTSSSTLYNAAITLPEDFNQTIIKARAYKAGYVQSDVASQSIEKCAKPVILNNYDGTFTLSCATGEAKITYTTSTSSNPTSSSTVASSPITVPEGTRIIKVRAFKAGLCQSDVLTYNLPQFPFPIISNNAGHITITCEDGGEIYYSTSESGIPETEYPAEGFDLGTATIVRAYAKHAGYLDSEISIWRPAELISSASQVNLDDPNGNYIINGNFSGSIGTSEKPFKGTIDGQCKVITGLDAPLVLYADGATIKNVILDNVSISNGASLTVSEVEKTAIGAIACVAKGTTRIYNCGILATTSTKKTNDEGYTEITSCSSSVGGTADYVGGLVGFLDGSSRVINCFNYANITAGKEVGGIVGHNNVATTSAANNQKTMVMNCMFYGDIDVDYTTNRAPIYNGTIITNVSGSNGVSNFNYFWAGASYVQNQKITSGAYNCALAAETRYLQRFEFFRHLLNSNRALAAWWATGNRGNKSEMLKWVMEPSQIGTSTPYPILKTFDRYPSVVNIDVNHSESYKGRDMTVGTKFSSTLSVTIRNSTTGGASAPSGAGITTSSLSLNIINKDPDHFNFNYYKVQLPYYNDVGTKNYTGNKVVTGWKIVSISGGTNSFSTDNDNNEATPADAEGEVDGNGDITLTTPYNFADRYCTDKDLYSVSGRVFSQGAYFDVPEGVGSITIEPYWANCVYVSDEYLDVVYNASMGGRSDVKNVGGGARFSNGLPSPINGVDQLVYTSMANAVTALDPSGTVYDNAIVLVGNVHSTSLSSDAKDKPFTIMSIDLDKDNEPDYSYILRFDGRVRVHPVRVDFLNVIGLGMAQKSSGGTGTYNFGIMQPYGWFECTNTGLFRVTQFEYDYGGENQSVGGVGNDLRNESPMILQGGVIEQWVTVGGKEQKYKAANSVTYYHVGSNVWFKEFHIGVHQDKTQNEFVSPHPPISVTGGDFDEFYLTGLYNTPNNNYDDNAECYINGGRFGKVAGTGMQGIGGFTKDAQGNKISYSDGNIIWQIDNADIDEFYAGGINAAHIAEGNIYTVISNSRVDQFCGGPKFGNMNNDKKVVTNAENCKFRIFFGAGYGGNSYNRRYPFNKNNLTSDPSWDSWVSDEMQYRYNSEFSGVETRIDYQYIPMSNNTQSVARLFVDHVSFSLATTYDVTSKLTDCTITKDKLGKLDLSVSDKRLGNFFGGGSLGKVVGPVKSTLTNCTVEGNVFGAGYSASKPKVDVMTQTFQNPPKFDKDLGLYLDAELPATLAEYTWEHADEVNSTATAIKTTGTEHILYTEENLDKSNLGSVNGDVTLTINGDSKIGSENDNTTGNVYGGGDASYVTGSGNKVTVNLQGKTEILGNVYGGGNEGLVEGSTEVNIE